MGDSDDGGGSYPGAGAINKLGQIGKMFGSGFVIKQVQTIVREQVVDMLQDAGHEELKNYIVVQYPLVQKKTPDEVKTALRNAGPNFEQEIRQNVTPAHVMAWLKDPDWLPEERADEREELQRMAEVIENTPGGVEWLQWQIIAVWEIAGVKPKEMD